MRLRLPPHLIL